MEIDMSLVGNEAPDFTATVVTADGGFDSFTLSEQRGKYVVLFFYPLDFTFVCPSELLAFNHRMDEFTKRGVEVVGCSVDSEHTHWAWRQTPVESGGIGSLNYSLIADLDKEIAYQYDVLHEEKVALRGSFLIDKEGVIQHAVINNLPLGRNVDEMIRMVDALQFHETHGEVCPAGWNAGDEGMKDTHDGVAEYLSKNADNL
ncbi:MAG: peroxiredoxin [Candidatus Thalassarchaeaceae archaeon]|nr:peroxiredoxin [Candidatus Thalassarchaeaceae archaeon]MDP7042995.1 peroxiredoxin [Candidatus Thalassarchaeaceae archaeon]